MDTALFDGQELREVSRMLAALLTIVGGIVMLFQTYLVYLLPPADGFQETTAIVSNLEQTGTFREPAFLVSLSYTVSIDGLAEEMRSGRRVDFEIYHTLSKGDEVQIHYNPQDPFEWRLIVSDSKLSDYGLGLIMLIFGMFSLTFPRIVRWGSRQQDFELTDELDDNPSLGVTSYRYGDNNQLSQE
jgi:hypothetical protein